MIFLLCCCKEGLSTKKIFLKTGINQSIISRMKKKNYQPHKTNAKYFSDFIRGAEWFMSL